MNKFLIATSVLLLGFSGYLGYRVIELTKKLQILTTAPSLKKCTSLSYDYSNGDFEGIINYETAKAIAENYQNDSAKAYITRNIKPGIISRFVERNPDTRSVWFALDRLKNFIWHIEQQNCEKGCNDSLGLRIYFAKYPDFNDLSQNSKQRFLGLDKVPDDYSNHHTLFMVPTYKNENGYHVDFYPGGNNCKTPFSSSPKQPSGIEPNDSVYVPTAYYFLMGTKEDAQNHGGLIPPGNPTGTSFNQ